MRSSSAHGFRSYRFSLMISMSVVCLLWTGCRISGVEGEPEEIAWKCDVNRTEPCADTVFREGLEVASTWDPVARVMRTVLRVQEDGRFLEYYKAVYGPDLLKDTTYWGNWGAADSLLHGFATYEYYPNRKVRREWQYNLGFDDSTPPTLFREIHYAPNGDISSEELLF